jgi:hypothetical protein
VACAAASAAHLAQLENLVHHVQPDAAQPEHAISSVGRYVHDHDEANVPREPKKHNNTAPTDLHCAWLCLRHYRCMPLPTTHALLDNTAVTLL